MYGSTVDNINTIQNEKSYEMLNLTCYAIIMENNSFMTRLLTAINLYESFKVKNVLAALVQPIFVIRRPVCDLVFYGVISGFN